MVNCKFCGNAMKDGRSYLSNPFCTECYHDRLIASKAVDMRDNFRINDLGNGYSEVVPIDDTKLWSGGASE